MVYWIRASDRAAFKRCRRQWDLGSRNRQNFEPTPQPRPIDVEQAVREALAVYYFPGMWEWNRAVVQPLVHQALDKSVRRQVEEAGGNPDEDSSAHEFMERGHALLDAYAVWAPTVDHFTPVRIETDFEVDIPDPQAPDCGLLTTDAEPVRYTDRVDLLVIDENDAYWAIQHRLVDDDWAEDDALQLDERTIIWAWAWPLFYLGMQLAGTIYNEIRVDAREPEVTPELAQPPMRHRRMYARSFVVPQERVSSQGTDEFRRTRIPRGAAELAAASSALSSEARAAIDPDVDIYPSPSPETCAYCSYTEPCLVLNEGGEPGEVLARSYRIREPEPLLEEGRLGGVAWSMGRGAAPPRWLVE